MGGAIRMIRDRAAGEELCEALGVPAVTRPDVGPVEDVDNADGRDCSMDQALLGKEKCWAAKFVSRSDHYLPDRRH